MAVSHSASSESHTGTSGSTNEASFSWTHTQTGTPKGVLVFVHTVLSTGDLISSVTYGGAALTRIAGAVAIDTAGEQGRTDFFFLGSGLNSGNQTITVNRTNSSIRMYASAATVLADTDTFVNGVLIEEENQPLSEENVDDGSVSGTDSTRYCGIYVGSASPPSPGSNSTRLEEIDLGSYGAALAVESTAGQGSRPVGFSGGSDDVAAVYVAIREAVNYRITSDVTSFNLVGIDADLLYVAPVFITAETGAFTATGVDAVLTKTVNKILVADNGIYSIAGIDSDIRRSILLVAEKGEVSEVGVDANIRRTISIFAERGIYSESGVDNNIYHAAILSAEKGTYTKISNDADISHAAKLVASTGTCSLVGNSADIRYFTGNTLSADTGFITVTGKAADIRYVAGNDLNADTGSITVTGKAAVISRNITITAAAAASYVVTGTAASFSKPFILLAASRTFNVTGRPIAIRYSSATPERKQFYYQLHDVELGLKSTQVNSSQLVYYINNYLRVL